MSEACLHATWTFEVWHTTVQAYQGYIRTILTRVNTINNRRYSEDPTVFSWELANEPSSTLDTTGQAVCCAAPLLLCSLVCAMMAAPCLLCTFGALQASSYIMSYEQGAAIFLGQAAYVCIGKCKLARQSSGKRVLLCRLQNGQHTYRRSSGHWMQTT